QERQTLGATSRLRYWTTVAAGVGVLLVLVLCGGSALLNHVFKQRYPSTFDVESRPAVQKELTNSLGLKLVYIPPGAFKMGSTQEEIDRFRKTGSGFEPSWFSVEGPDHPVEIGKRFSMATTEVTVGQYRKFVEGSNYNTGDERWRKPEFEQTED